MHHLRDKFVEGDDHALSEIYELYAKDLYALGLTLKAKTELIEDSIHDIFVEIYMHRHCLENVDNLKYYLITAFRNRLFFLLKKDSVLFEISEKEISMIEEKDSQELWIEKEEYSTKRSLVNYLLSELSRNQREAIYHRYVENMTCDEIARLMNINYQSAKNLISRAIKKMRSGSKYSMFHSIIVK
jgi:RNA polymerase sigma factor (sigma-70 family)